jgi:carbamoyltransferase
MKNILGISAFYHDSAAALLQDGEIVAAAQEERFSREKGDARFPSQAIAHCLAEGGIGLTRWITLNIKAIGSSRGLAKRTSPWRPEGFESFRLDSLY